MRTVKFLPFLIIIGILASACMPIQPPVEEAAIVTLSNDTPEYAERGSHWVGYTSHVIGEGTDRQLDAGLWYPALNPTGKEEAVTYEITIKMADLQSDMPSIVYGSALQDAPIEDDAGPYPLVIFSHGFGLNAATYHTILEHYASHGFIVLAPEHMEDDWFNNMTATVDRPLDIKRTLDYAAQLTAPDGELAGLIDMENVAVAGHSYGGYTALAAAGAQIDFDAMTAHCAELAEDDPKTFLCMPLQGKEADMAAYAGLDTVPEGLWPSLGDPRVSAIIPMAGDAYLFGDEGLANLTIPMMAIGGTADTSAPYDWGTKLSYDATSSPQKALVALEGAEHMIMGSPCEDMPWISGHPFSEYICVDPAWDKQQALDLIHHFSTAFLLDTLQDDPDAQAALLPDAVDFAGIYYTSTQN